MNLDLNEEEVKLILQILDQISIKATQPDAVQVATLLQGLLAKLKS